MIKRPRSSVWSNFTVDPNNQAIAIFMTDGCKNNKVQRGKRQKTSRLKLFRSIYRIDTKETMIVPEMNELRMMQQNKQR